jgi:hypothetical protein
VARRLAGGVDAAAATVAAMLLDDGAPAGVPAEDAPVAAGASAAY